MSKILKALNVEDITGYECGVLHPFLTHDYFYNKPHNTKPVPLTLERVYKPYDKRWKKKFTMYGEVFYTYSKKILD